MMLASHALRDPSPKSGGESPHSRRFAILAARPFRAQRLEIGFRSTGEADPAAAAEFVELHNPTAQPATAAAFRQHYADGDGMTDAWEAAHDLNPAWAGDAALDSDLDRAVNLGQATGRLHRLPARRSVWRQVAAANGLVARSTQFSTRLSGNPAVSLKRVGPPSARLPFSCVSYVSWFN